MPAIRLELFIRAPARVCFDLARSIDLHMISTPGSDERAVAGRTSGLIEKGESVTWEAKHLGIKQRLTVRIIEMEPYHRFLDRMERGAFKSFLHEHLFEEKEGGTLMTDTFIYESPFGTLGRIADLVYIKKYMTRLLTTRNDIIKDFAESERWKEVLSAQPNNRISERNIYIKLLGEGSIAYRPVPAIELEKKIYEVRGHEIHDREDEIWEFLPGSHVLVEEQELGGVLVLVAIREKKHEEN